MSGAVQRGHALVVPGINITHHYSARRKIHIHLHLAPGYQNYSGYIACGHSLCMFEQYRETLSTLASTSPVQRCSPIVISR